MIIKIIIKKGRKMKWREEEGRGGEAKREELS